jgi:hypothetical protein
MKRNAVLYAALVGLGLTTALPMGVSRAENAPTTKPSHEMRDGSQPKGSMMRLRDGDRPRAGFGGIMPAAPTDEEWKQIESFVAENSPNRLKKLQQYQTKNEPGVPMFRTFIATRYRALMAMKEHDPEMYERRLKQFQLEDEIIGQIGASEKGTMSNEEREAMLENVGKLVEMDLEEREYRIERLQNALSQEQERLQKDRNRQEALVQRKLDDISRSGARALMMDGPRMKREGAPDKGPKPPKREDDAK